MDIFGIKRRKAEREEEKERSKDIEKAKQIAKKREKAFKEELRALKSEALDWGTAIHSFGLYLDFREQFISDPTPYIFSLVEHWLNETRKDFTKIKKDTHTVEHMLRWMRVQLKNEDELLRALKAANLHRER